MVWVALLTEGVDRNEPDLFLQKTKPLVALLTEGVDRNQQGLTNVTTQDSRPPHGGRG